MKKTILDPDGLTVTFKQEGYGRQGMYINGHYLRSVFPNFEEHFGIVHINDAFICQDEEGNLLDYDGKPTTKECYRDMNGEIVEEVYTSPAQYLVDNYEEQLIEFLKNC